MGFDRRFTLALLGWIAALVAAIAALGWALATPGLAAARIVAGIVVALAAAGLWRHVERTNVTVARFVEALRLGDTQTRFDARGGAGFGALGAALNDVMRRAAEDRERSAQAQRYLEALVDDMPVALLTVDAARGVTPGNKAARRLFDRHEGTRPDDYAVYGASFAARLADTGAGRQNLLIMQLAGAPQRAIVRSASLERLGLSVKAVTVEPVGGTLDAVEMAAQSDLVRVLTHEVLNSLTPVVSLADSVEGLLRDMPGDPRVADARAAVDTLARRARGLGRFIESYRAVAQPPAVRKRLFLARPWADELARLFGADRPAVALSLTVTPPDLAIDADPDLLAQAAINLLRNAADAAEASRPEVMFRLEAGVGSRVCIDVEDNGPGVPQRLRQDIFLPFFTTRAQGTGVGLNLVRQIVVAHGGTVDVTSGAMGGALFRLDL